jgi:single-strand DNA-binding protein
MNNLTIAGRLGNDAEQKFFGDGNSVVNFSVAVNRPKKNGQKQDALWVRVALFGKLGESLLPFLTKGTTVGVSGELNVRTYEAKGATQVSVDLNARQVSLLGGGQAAETVPAEREPGSDEEFPAF